MAEASGGQDGNSVGAIVAIAVLLLGPLLVVIFIVMGVASAAQPGPNGVNGQPIKINANPATSAFAADLGDFQRFKDVNGYLSKNSPLLSDLQTRLMLIDSKLTDGVDYEASNGVTIPGATVTKLKDTVIVAIMADITNIKTQVANNTPKNATKYLTDLTTNLNKLQIYSSGGSGAVLAQTATQIVNFNNDGKGSIKFPSPDSEAIVYGSDKNTPALLDCAGFVSYTLQKAGIFRAGESAITTDFVNKMSQDSRFQVVDFVDGGKLDLATILKEAQPGDIFLSNTGDKVSVNSNNQDHSVIYLGNVGTTPTIAESTDGETPGKNGPQFDSLQDRYDNHGNIQMILRPIGVAQ